MLAAMLVSVLVNVFDRRQAYRTTRARTYSTVMFRKSEDGPIADPVQDVNRGAVAAAIRPTRVNIGKPKPFASSRTCMTMLSLHCIINLLKVRMMVSGDSSMMVRGASSCRRWSTVGAPIRTPQMISWLDPDKIKVLLVISRKAVLGAGFTIRTERQSWDNRSEPLSSGPDER